MPGDMFTYVKKVRGACNTRTIPGRGNKYPSFLSVLAGGSRPDPSDPQDEPSSEGEDAGRDRQQMQRHQVKVSRKEGYEYNESRMGETIKREVAHLLPPPREVEIKLPLCRRETGESRVSAAALTTPSWMVVLQM